MVEIVTILTFIVVAYFVLLNLSLLALFLVGRFRIRREKTTSQSKSTDAIFVNPSTPGVSIIVPAKNEENVVLDCVDAALGATYPTLEVIVVDDESTDATFDVLNNRFGLRETDLVCPDHIAIEGKILSIWTSEIDSRLMVVRKESSGRSADALNAGLSLASMPLYCTVDADSLIDHESLLHLVEPFLDSPEEVVATGGSVHASNADWGTDGRIIKPRFPRRMVEGVQAVEYLRSFLLGRSGWDAINSVMIISGAFGLFDRDTVIRAGGYDADCVSQDLELVYRLHRVMRDEDRPYRIAYVPRAICWTEVPHSWAQLKAQRIRWSHGLAEAQWKHRGMLSPKYGRIGMLAFPYSVLFEALTPFVELLGFALVVASLVLGLIDIWLALIIVLIAVGLGMCFTLVGCLTERSTYNAYGDHGYLHRALMSGLVELTVYRPVHAAWRAYGFVTALFATDHDWASLARNGLSRPSSQTP